MSRHPASMASLTIMSLTEGIRNTGCAGRLPLLGGVLYDHISAFASHHSIQCLFPSAIQLDSYNRHEDRQRVNAGTVQDMQLGLDWWKDILERVVFNCCLHTVAREAQIDHLLFFSKAGGLLYQKSCFLATDAPYGVTCYL